MRRKLGLCLLFFALLTTLLPAPAHGQADTPLELPDAALLADPVFARPGFANIAQPFLERTRYLLALDLDTYRGVLQGRARIFFVNNTGSPLANIVLRLYPNHPVHQGRQMTLGALSIDGQAASGQFTDTHNTVYEIGLATPIAAGGQATIDVDYTINTPATSFFYISEPFPMIAVYDQFGWRRDVATTGLDYAYTESALFAVNLRAPSRVDTWFTGAIKSNSEANNQTTYTIVTGPVRNFVVVQAQSGGTVRADGGPVPIVGLYLGSATAAQEISQIALAAFTFYEANFGPYPYAEFNFVSMLFPSGGEEYPSLVFINNDRTSIYRRFITAHEVAHQWFYGLAGNNTLDSAWLDESLTQYAGYVFYLKTGYGSANAAEEYWSHILRWSNAIGVARPIDTPMANFNDFSDYMSTVYGGGAVFLRQLGEQIGVDALVAGMRAYVSEVNLGIGKPCQFFNAVQRQTSISLAELFRTRVGIVC
jgi:hypothetical protein